MIEKRRLFGRRFSFARAKKLARRSRFGRIESVRVRGLDPYRHNQTRSAWAKGRSAASTLVDKR